MKKSDETLKNIIDSVKSWSDRKKLLVLLVVWALIFLPAITLFTSIHRRTMFSHYPSSSSPLEVSQEDWNVTLYPEAELRDDRYYIHVEEGEKVNFRWEAEDYSARVHLGQVNVYYNTSWGDEGVIRLDQIAEESEGPNETWEKEHEFDRSGGVYYYYRGDKSDIALYQRRASVILEGGNIYEDIRTDPPPLINFIFVPPTALSAPVSLGGYFLSFYVYFSLIILAGSFLLFETFKGWGRTKAFFSSLLYLTNPLAVYTLFQDSGVVALLLILSIFLMVKGWKKTGFVSIAMGVAAKVWSGFFIPANLFDRNIKTKTRTKYLLISTSTLGATLLFFYILWGPNTFFFITFYGGGASKFAFQGINIWSGIQRVSPFGLFFSTDHVLILLVIIGVLTLYVAYKNKWDTIAIFTVLFLIFLMFYPKIHWWYYFIPFPVLVFYSLRNKRNFYLFVGLIGFTTLANFSRHRYLYILPSYINNWISFISALIFTLIGLKIIHIFITEDKMNSYFEDIFEDGD